MATRSTWVRRVADGYRQLGYDVLVDPAAERVPPRVAWLRFDLIAQRDDEHVLVLIEGDDDQLRLVTGVVGDVPRWRLAVHRFDEECDAPPTA